MKAAILGMGNMGKVHRQVYKAAGVEVVTYDPKDNFGTVRAVIQEADIVSVCSPDNFHAEQIIQAFAMGKHVFCEKPLCHTHEEFEAIKAAYNKECALGINFPLRWHKPFVEAKQTIKDLGEIYLVEADYEYGRAKKYIHGWRGQMPEYSIVMGGGLHMIDVVDWITGLPMEFNAAQHFWQARRFATVGIGQLGGGVILKLTCDFGGSKNHARRLRISGTEGSIYIDDREPTDKGLALRMFLYCLEQCFDDEGFATQDVPSPADVFRVHEIGLSL